MESGLPLLNYLLQHTLRSLCSSTDSSNSSTYKWVYAVFWRILPRIFPPPKWENGGSVLDRSKGNKRNWILVWEDGFCDFDECQQAGRFGPDVFFKMSHEVYNYGEGLVGKVAADNSHKWVFRDTANENDPGVFSAWSVSFNSQPRAWELQFNSGIQTIALVSVREGTIQLGSLNKVTEDLNLVINIQRRFSYLQSMPGLLAIQRPYVPITSTNPLCPSNQYSIKTGEASLLEEEGKQQSTGLKRSLYRQELNEMPIKSVNLGWNTPQNGLTGPPPPLWSLPPLLPTLSCSFGAFFSKMPSATPSNCLGALLDYDRQTTKTSGGECGLDGAQEAAVKVEPPLY